MRYSGIAQLVEHLTVNQVVVSSSLTAGANSKGLVMIRQSLFSTCGVKIVAF